MNTKKRESPIDMFIDTLSISYNDDLTENWKEYQQKSLWTQYGLKYLPLQPNYTTVTNIMEECRLCYDEDWDLNIYSEVDQKEVFGLLLKLNNIKKMLIDQIADYVTLKNTHPKYELIYWNLSFRLDNVSELVRMFKERLLEIEPFPFDYTVNKGESKSITINKKFNKINLRMSQYELAYICTVLKTMKLLPEYMGRKFDKRFIEFIERHFTCLDVHKNRFVQIKDFRSTMSKVTREGNAKRNNKIKKKEKELLEESFKVVGEYINTYNNIDIINYKD